MHIHLQTARLAIRRFTAADEDNLVRLNSDPEVMRYITGGQPVGREEIRDEIIPFHVAAYDRHPGRAALSQHPYHNRGKPVGKATGYSAVGPYTGF